MKQFSENELDVLWGILEKHEKELKAKGGYYVDVGYKYKGGKPTDILAIRVHVHEKKPEIALEPSQLIPRKIEEIPTDVIQSKPGKHQNRERRYDTLLGGIAVWNPKYRKFGTLGAIVYDAKDSSKVMGLSNWHILVRSGLLLDNFFAGQVKGTVNILLSFDLRHLIH
ncbi:MAG: hypothetical protein DCC43_14850 [Candidatus Brocadia sp.]|nr:hypothetical protein [Candidatus Brocadia fulgida]MCC6325814.1 hypothetical protein [Candidatus Brocadia sp.]MCE7911446.1 hypothetical protein [Candidatus Brocadia sp. AMX3]RIJ90410.1 MAG: hypothetical protein DCC43_14850 [Candidatus Brocadia sp.]